MERSGDPPTSDDITVSARLAVARRRAHAGEAEAAIAAVRAIEHPKVGEILAMCAAVDGRWSEAVEGFQTTRKLLARDRGVRQGLLGAESLRWFLIALLARNDPKDLVTARKLCVAESGTRKSRPEGFGLWAHAIACRLGEERPIARAFAGPPARRGEESDDDADRLLLAAWLGLEPDAWHQDECHAVVDELELLHRTCRADLVRDAIDRLGLPHVPILNGRSSSAPPFFGAPREPWREALEAMTRLAPAPHLTAATQAPPTLVWQIDIDEIGRITDITPHERSEGARGRARFKEITLAKVARSATLDPRDAAVARSIESMRKGRSSYGIDVATAAVALVGHPCCVFRDALDEPIDLREALPELEVRRVRIEDGSEAFEFELLDPIREDDLPFLGDRWTASNPETEIARRNSIRILPRLNGEARLIRITPTQRQVAELISRRWRVPVDAKAELDEIGRAHV